MLDLFRLIGMFICTFFQSRRINAMIRGRYWRTIRYSVLQSNVDIGRCFWNGIGFYAKSLVLFGETAEQYRRGLDRCMIRARELRGVMGDVEAIINRRLGADRYRQGADGCLNGSLLVRMGEALAIQNPPLGCLC